MPCSRGDLPSASLPSWELTFYLAITLGFHFYSFYQVYKVSRTYEEDLDADFGFEKGFFIWGFKKDPTDFEWSFWTEWVKKLLVWTLLGHIIVSQVTSAFLLKFRMWLLMIYGMLACFYTVGYKGLVLILLHLLISYTVAQLQLPVLSWLCSILLLYSLQMESLGKIQKRWYETENEYFLLLFCLALCNLRYTSFSLEYCRHRDSPQKRYVSFCWLLAYVFYYPVFHNGPIICYDDFNNQMRKAETFVPKTDLLCLLLSGMRILFWWWLTESMLQLMYIHAIQEQETILESASYWTLGGLGFAHALFFYMKYLLLYGIPSIIMCLDGIEPPKLPRCTSSLYSFTGTWREFDVGLHRWLVRCLSARMQRRAHAAFASVATTLLILSNLVFLCGNQVGKIYWNRTFVQGWPWIPIAVLAYFYCYAQVGIEYDRIKN
ncbi:protein-cysteine N-palmitoyltransferase HHAT isoform X4 [Scyliorhinus canicula]|uniref:protein-cysteine N-palmitoyltransferase HHAT isoform X4 n=1 Tax=Scyliorhinus canicula TaxID=7830 RepID=UPI0018F73652|nr:protein-cysteine N-palmitoyltransferase HHAT isoform X4 [Scyliorhinus canicula]